MISSVVVPVCPQKRHHITTRCQPSSYTSQNTKYVRFRPSPVRKRRPPLTHPQYPYHLYLHSFTKAIKRLRHAMGGHTYPLFHLKSLYYETVLHCHHPSDPE